jgi:hypothetical protein
VDIRSRANTTRGLDYEHMIKALAHKGGVRIGKTPKKGTLKYVKCDIYLTVEKTFLTFLSLKTKKKLRKSDINVNQN